MLEAKSIRHTDVTVVGGGITGIVAALRLAKGGARVLLADRCLPGAEGKLGGFARFSGAKFSLPPAGLGLVDIAGSHERLVSVIAKVLELIGLTTSPGTASVDARVGFRGSVIHRSYESLVLNPSEIEDLISGLEKQLRQAAICVLPATATRLDKAGDNWETTIEVANADGSTTEECITSRAVFFAAGRLAEDVMQHAGASPTEGKGLDIGIRLEFVDRESLRGLRALGPDAKIIDGACRTFCLNSPGQIYYYPFGALQLPGGVVADSSEKSGNVGVLMRVSNKHQRLNEFMDAARPHTAELRAAGKRALRDSEFQLPPVATNIYREDAVKAITAFCRTLHREGLIDLNSDHRIHMPLLDWHWPTWAKYGTHQTSLTNVYALGDSAGHARGLLQGAVSGWLAAEEFLC